MTAPAPEVASAGSQPPARSRALVVSALGATQIMAWGSSYYLIAVLAKPIAAETGWPLSWIVGGLSVGLLVAGLVSHWVGKLIQDHGGRPVLAASSLLLAAGLTGLGMAQNLLMYALAWVVLGLGMGAGLYDAAFSTLVRLYGQDARRAITGLTLWGGFASTLCWPLSAYLVEHLGWRGACLSYATIQIGFSLPAILLATPGLPQRRATPGSSTSRAAHSPAGERRARGRGEFSIFLMLATVLTLGSVVMSLISVHLITILQAVRGLDLATAVAFGAVVGPSQVGARVVEMVFADRYHPVWTMVTSVVLVAAGLALLAFGFPATAVALVVYGGGNGLNSIARGSLPLALFGPNRYPVWMGRLATPTLVAGALSPSLGGAVIDLLGPGPTLHATAGIAACNAVLAFVLALRVKTGLPRGAVDASIEAQ